MSNRAKSVTIIFGALLAVILIIVGIMYFGSMNFSQGVILRAENGSCLLIKGTEPIVLSAKGKIPLDKLETGDKVLVAHSGIAESYPARTRAYFVIKLGSGYEIDKNVMSTLSELGWVQQESRQIAFSAQYIRTDGDYPTPYFVVIRSKKELEDYYNENKDRFDLERKTEVYSDTTIGFLDACDRYTDDYFAENILILAVITEPSGSNRHEVASVSCEGGKLVVTVNRIIPEVGTCDMACWHIFVEAGREECTGEAVELVINE